MAAGGLARASLHALGPAIALAFVLALSQAALSFALSRMLESDVALWTSLALLVGAHAVFVVFIARRGLSAARLRSPLAAAGAIVILALAFGAYAWLDTKGADFQCADGVVLFASRLPMWPWLWIGWAALTYMAAPVRLLASFSKTPLMLVPPMGRLTAMAPFAAVVVLLGAMFQIRRADCDATQISFGLLEGGLFVLPLYALFLFAMSFSMAILSAVFVKDDGV